MTILDRVLNSSSLPSLPAVAVQLLELARDPEVGLMEIAELVKADPALSVKLLKTANSAFYGFRHEVTTLDRAIPLMGRTVVTSVSLSFVLMDQAKGGPEVQEHFDNYWRQSIVQAVAAEEIAIALQIKSDGTFFQTALLADLGRLALLKTVSDEYRGVLEDADLSQRFLWELESERLGLTHPEVGAALLRKWNISPTIVQAVEHHHHPVDQLRPVVLGPGTETVLVTALACAVGVYFCQSSKGFARRRLSDLITRLTPLDESHIEVLMQRIREKVEQASEPFSIDPDQIPEPSSLMAEANEQLAMVAIREHALSRDAIARNRTLETENLELVRKTIRDTLTNSFNRTYFMEALTKEVARCKRYSRAVGVLFLDIDHFKSVNDTYGHGFGDEVLIGVARTLAESLRDTDMCARFGGEEFAVLVVEPNELGLQKVAERVRERIETIQFPQLGTPFHVTVSVGATMVVPATNDASVADRMLETADAAMYQAKQTGRNRVVIQTMMTEQQRAVFKIVGNRRMSRWLVREGLLDRMTVFRCLQQMQPEEQTVYQLCLAFQLLTEQQLQTLEKIHERTGDWFGTIALDHQLMSEDQLSAILALQQEDPAVLTAELIAQGAVPAERGQRFLSRYMETLFPGGDPRVASRADSLALSMTGDR